MRSSPSITSQQYGLFTAAQALAEGWSYGSLKFAVRTDRLIRVRPGIFLESDRRPESAEDRLGMITAAALLALPRATASHYSAAVLAGLPVLQPPTRPCLTVLPRKDGAAPAIHLHRAQLGPEDLVSGPKVGSTTAPAGRPLLLRRTSAARTTCDIAREFGVSAGVVTADAALRDGLTSTDDLNACLLRCSGWPRIGNAVRAVALADGRSESALESLSRLQLARHRLPRPELQRVLRDVHGNQLGRVDFYWSRFGVVGEADGRAKYEARYSKSVESTLFEEKIRQERLERAGFRVVRWGWADLHNFQAVAARLRAAFAASAGA